MRSTSTFRRSSWAASRPFQSTTPARTRFSHRRSSSTLSSSPSLPRFVLRHQPRQEEGGEEVVEGFGLFSVGCLFGSVFVFGRWRQEGCWSHVKSAVWGVLWAAAPVGYGPCFGHPMHAIASSFLPSPLVRSVCRCTVDGRLWRRGMSTTTLCWRRSLTTFSRRRSAPTRTHVRSQ